MSTEIKNTLFRFVTMRAPELLESDQVKNYFVELPDMENEASQFLSAVDNIPQGMTKKEVLASTAAGFSAYPLRESLRRALSDDFYDFAVWLTANRSVLTVSEVDKRIQNGGAAIVPIADDLAIKNLWDNLFYQIITYKSGSVREAILSLLVADFFLRKRSSVKKDDETYRRLAKARVIIPKNLFAVESRNIPATDYGIDLKSHQRQAKAILLGEEIANIENSLLELQRIEKIYERANARNHQDYVKRYEEAVRSAYSKATKVVKTYTDPATGIVKEYVTYTDLNLPQMNYTPLAELDLDAYGAETSESLNTLVKVLVEKKKMSTFSDVYAFLKEQLRLQTEKRFKLAELSKEVINVGGTILPVSSSLRQTPVFSIYDSGLPTQKKLILLFDGIDSGSDVNLANYTLKFPDNTTISGAVFADSLQGDKLRIDIFNLNGQYFNPAAGQKQFTIAAQFSCTNGKTIHAEGSAVINQLPTGIFPPTAHEPSEYTTIITGRGDLKVTGNGTYRITQKTLSGDEEENGPEAPSAGNLIEYVPSGFGIKRLGIADYRKVEQEVCCYVPGEVSHIENIMAREYKEKSTRRLRRSEDTTTSSSEKEIEKLSDTSSTDRFEMNQEVASVMAEDSAIGVHASFNADYGPAENHYGLQTGADFAHNVSQETSDSQAVMHAKDITERALDRVVTKVKEERLTKVIEEFEENNKHGFDNRKGSQHVSGVFRWVDKIYKNHVVNYGKRLMYEFMIPEPAAFHTTMAKLNKSNLEGELPKMPVDPRTFEGDLNLKDYTMVKESTYAYWAGVYNAVVEPPKPDEVYVGKSITAIYTTDGYDNWGNQAFSKKDDLDIPEGYAANRATVMFAGFDDADNYGKVLSLMVGNAEFTNSGGQNNYKLCAADTLGVNPVEGKLPISLTGQNCHNGNAAITVKCILNETERTKWKLETFNAIISAYEEKLDAYNAKVAELRALAVAQSRTNPLFYRQIENSSLRKNCIEYLASHGVVGGTELLNDRNAYTVHAKYDDPVLETYSAKVKFFEQAFEWDLMSYYFYPFYWAKKDQWSTLYPIDNDDKLFRSFLQSGMARIILTVRPGFEEAVNWYMATGQIWNGGQVPTLDDELFISIVQELQTPVGTVEETWESRVPTSLTVIQAGTIGLNVEGLPCDDDCKDFKQFDSDGNPVLDENGDPVLTNPLQQQDGVTLGNVVEEAEALSEAVAQIQEDITEIKTALNIQD
ncbi:MAG TPA: hypothetical protein VGB50_13705 [Flavobacterium sp.]|jgi:hypothetical protein